MQETAVVLTTIHVPRVIDQLEENRIRFRAPPVQYTVVADRKTPLETGKYLATLRARGIDVEYLDITAQVDFLRDYSSLAEFIPLDSFARRNIGDLWAFKEGCQRLIRIDDDNFPTDQDFFGGHSATGKICAMSEVKSSSGWFNCTDLLKTESGRGFFPRGYPYSVRNQKSELNTQVRELKVGVCAGLWSGDPDVDAITRIHDPVRVTGLKEAVAQIGLAPGTWCPINTQNTSYRRDLIAAAWVSPSVGRYDDIFSGYCLRALMDHFGDSVVYGRPLLFQERNPHDLWSDLEKEMFGNRHLGELIEALRVFTPKASSYAAAYRELSHHLRDQLKQPGYEVLWKGMEIWSECFL